MTLNVDGRAFAFSDSKVDHANGLYWSFDPNPDWTDGRHISLSATATVVPAEVTVSKFKVTPDNDRLTVKWRSKWTTRPPHCGFVLQWREGSSGAWVRREFAAHEGYSTQVIDNLKSGTSYQVRLLVKSGYVDIAPTQKANVTVKTTGSSGSSAHRPGETGNTSGALTARVAAAPAEHDGRKGFKVRIAFSAPVAAGAKKVLPTLRLDGAKVTRARRVGKRHDLWELRIRPRSHGAVTLTLPATADCAAKGAVCASNGRKLGSALTLTVPGPAALAVENGSALEGRDAAIAFRVSLSRRAAGAVTVDYATRDVSARAGEDYAAASGTLTFAPGERQKTVSVAVLDDAHDEGEELFKLALSNATGARIADAEAWGMIKNTDPLQQDWLARFGRAAAADAVAAVTARLETPRAAGSHLTVGGHRLSLDGSGTHPALAPATAGGPGGADWPAWSGDSGASRTMSGRELLLGTSFRAVLGGGAGARWTGWGQGASVSAFSGNAPGLSLSGETATGSLGMDYEHGRLLTGFAMTHSLGEGTAQGAGRRYALGSAVTTMLPYARYALTERVSAWGMAGTGSGRLTLDLDGGAAERYGADLAMTLAAVGVRGDLLRPAEPGGFALALKADAFWVRTESDVGLRTRRGEPRGGAGGGEPAAGGAGWLAQLRALRPPHALALGRARCFATTGATRRPGRASSSAPVSATRTRRGASMRRFASTGSRRMPRTATPNGACRDSSGSCRAPPGGASRPRSRRPGAWTPAARSGCGCCRTRPGWSPTTTRPCRAGWMRRWALGWRCSAAASRARPTWGWGSRTRRASCAWGGGSPRRAMPGTSRCASTRRGARPRTTTRPSTASASA